MATRRPTAERGAPEDGILRRCALRFDGRRYLRDTGFDPRLALEVYFQTGEFPEDELERWGLYTALHRRLLAWGREGAPRDGREWFAFRALFLELCPHPVPPAYRLTPYADEWERDWRPRLPELLATVKHVHEHTYYRDEALPAT